MGGKALGEGLVSDDVDLSTTLGVWPVNLILSLQLEFLIIENFLVSQIQLKKTFDTGFE